MEQRQGTVEDLEIGAGASLDRGRLRDARASDILGSRLAEG